MTEPTAPQGQQSNQPIVSPTSIESMQRLGSLLEKAGKDLDALKAKTDAAFKAAGEVEPIELVSKDSVSNLANISSLSKNTMLELTKAAKSLSFEGFKKTISVIPEIKDKALTDIDMRAAYDHFKKTGSIGGAFFAGSFGSALAGIPKEMSKKLESLSQMTEKLGLDHIIGKSGLVAGAKFSEYMFDQFDKMTGGLYSKSQDIFLPINKQAQQTAMAFGEIGKGLTYEEAKSATREFGTRIATTAGLANQRLADVRATTLKLAESMGIAAATRPIDFDESLVKKHGDLKNALDNSNQSLTALNSVSLISNATGVESAAIADNINTAQLELGATLKDSIDMFGLFKDSADKSGLGIGRVSQSIISSTQALKMWGGTITSVKPIFDMFSASLKEGQRGLAPELLQRFTAGIEGMSFAQRAFIGMQAGMGGAGGALGAGLEMEAALEDKSGVGMQKVIGNLTDMLKQQGGGQVITRQQAIADPALQAGFLMQRQLTMQMLRMDEATATKTLDALAGVGEAGIKTGMSGEQAVLDLMESGKRMGDENTSTQEKMAQRVEQAFAVGSEEIVNSAMIAAERVLGVQTILKGMDTLFKNGISVRQLDTKEVSKAVDQTVEKAEVTAKKGRGVLKKMYDAIFEKEEEKLKTKKTNETVDVKLPEPVNYKGQLKATADVKLPEPVNYRPQIGADIDKARQETVKSTEVQGTGRQAQTISKEINLQANVVLKNSVITIDLKEVIAQTTQEIIRSQQAKAT